MKSIPQTHEIKKTQAVDKYELYIGPFINYVDRGLTPPTPLLTKVDIWQIHASP